MSVTDRNTADNCTMWPSVLFGVTKSSDYEHKCITPTYEFSAFDVKRKQPLPWQRKIIEFYTAPITKFLAYSVSKIRFKKYVFNNYQNMKLKSQIDYELCTVMCYLPNKKIILNV